MNGEKDEAGNTPGHYWARGAMWFLIWMGFGGCCMMANRSAKEPLISITMKP